MLQEFRSFVMRGNLVELAVAFIMGVAFATVVTAFTDVLLGTIAYAVGGEIAFDDIGVRGEDGDIVIPVGAFLSALASFLIVAAVLFLIVRAYQRARKVPEETPTTRPCPYCRTEIAREASRCPNCTSQLEARPT